ncbi:MAG TPA: CHAT domain-containing protein [Flavilitoribacter sp.]|nr:CHAT domain-containing protein [Flavilitoribacter sp.]
MRYLLPCLCFWWLAAGVTAQTTDGDAAGQWKKLGKEFQQKRQFDSSTYYLRMALPLFKKAEKWDEYYWLQQDIAYNYLDQGQPEAGLRAVQAAVDDLESRPPADSQLTVVLGDLYRAKGVIYYESGHYREAKSAYEQGLEVYRRALDEDNTRIGFTFNNLANVCYRDFRIKEAIDLYEKALAIKRKNLPADHPSVLSSLSGLANTYDLFGDFPKALAYHRQCYEAAKAKNIRADMAIALGNMGLVYNHMGDFRSGLEYSEQSRLLTEALFGSKARQAALSWQVSGNAYYQLGDFEAALTCYQAILDAYDPREKRFFQEYANALINVGMTWRELKEFDKAVEAFKQALAYFKRVYPDENHVKIAEIYNNLGECLYDTGKPVEAKAYYRNALGINRRMQAQDNVEIIRACMRLAVAEPGLDSALFFVQQVLELTAPGFHPAGIQDNPDITGARWPDLLLQGLNQKAILARRKYQQSRDESWLDLAETAVRLSEQLAEAQLKNAGADDSKIAFFAHTGSLYAERLRIAGLLQKRPGETANLADAWQTLERARSTVLLGKMNVRELMQLGGVPEADRDRYWSSSLKLAHLDQDLADGLLPDSTVRKMKEEQFALRQENDRIRDQLLKDYPGYKSLQNPEDPPSMKTAVAKILAPGELLVEYLFRDTSLFIFTADAGRQTLHEIPFPQQLEDEVAGFRKELTDISGFINEPQKAFDAYIRRAYRLYALLIAPIEEEAGNKNVLIIPDGVLHRIPFEVLVTDTSGLGQKPDFRELSYLFRKRRVRYAVSAAVLLQQLDQSGRRRGRGVLAAAPVYRPLAALEGIPATRAYNKLQPLPGAAEEARRVQSFFSGRILEGAACTERAFRDQAGQYAILHLATHAVVDEADPLRSFLALAAADDSLNEGYLYAWELANLDLSAQLAVLSACSTGEGKLTESEGLLSLGRAFTMAGVPSIVMSLWPVADATTSDLMTPFYQSLARGKPKDEALRAAKEQYLASADPLFAHPYYWAGFILQGDPRPMRSGNPMAGWWWAGLILAGMGGVFYWRRR